MSSSDKWKKPRRPCVQRYFDYKKVLQDAVADQACGSIPTVPDEINMTFRIPMPESWPIKKKAEMCGKPHRQRPDKDNLEKGLNDALFEEDCEIWKGSQEKLWCKAGDEGITMEMIWHKEVQP